MRNFVRRSFIAFIKNHRENISGWIFIALIAIPGLSLAQPSLSLSPSNFNGYNISCHGLTDGSIDLAITGGAPPFDILWSTAETTEDISNLPAGNYAVRVIDANTDTAETNIDLVEPDSLQFSFTLQNEICGTSNGSITANLTGGVQPYTYLWSTSATGAVIFTIGAGTYTITVTDLNLCTDEDTAAIINIPAPAATISSITNVNCFGTSNGSIDILVSNGTSPFSYLWSSGETTEDLLNHPAGNYTMTVTDLNLCTSSVSDVITQPDSIQVSFSSTNELCNQANGTIDAGVTGGLQPYSYLWSNGSTGNLISGLSAGTYTVTITDFNLCVNQDTFSITNIAAPAATVSSITNVNCFGGSDGTIDIEVNNGTSPFSYLWSSGETTEDLLNHPAGSYTMTVTDFNLCTSSVSDVITQPDSIQVSFSSTNELCNQANGTIDAGVTGGVQPYSYLWSNGSTGNLISGLAAGTYTVTITDFNLCVNQDISSITNIAAPVATVFLKIDVNCYGGNDGSIDLAVNNGTPPFSYNWTNGATTQDLSNLEAGNYNVTVTDFNLCASSTGEVITQPDSIDIGFNIIPASGGPNGKIFSTVTGGVLAYSYLWSTGATVDSIYNLIPGVYELTVTDAHSCIESRSGVVQNAGAVCSVSVTSVTNVSCYGEDDGSIDISISGTFPPETYLWSNGATTQDINTLVAGTYTVTVTDNISCITSTSVTVTQPDTLNLTFNKTNETCSGANGSITVNVSGGSIPYSYLWSGGATTSTISGLSAGTYTVTVFDNNSCSKSATTSITNVVGPVITLDSVHNVSCFGLSDGDIYITASSGTSPYSYLWSNSATTQNLINVSTGTYTVTVTDNIGCTATLSQSISEPAQLNATISSSSEICGNANGSATANPTGGTTPYSYLWSNSQTTQAAINLAAATYTVTVTDNHSCTVSKTVVISNIAGPTAQLDSVRDVNCFSQANGAIYISVIGGTIPYSYLWSNASNSQDLVNVIAGTYTVTVTDDNGCTATLSATINEPVQLSVSTSTTNSTCGSANGTATATPLGGTSPYTFLWSNAQSTQTAIGLAAATYTVTVTDNHSCTSTATAVVSNTAGPAIIVDSTHNVSCFGLSNGGVFISVSTGTAPFSYLWSDASTDQDLTNVISGTYTVTVTDNNGCTATVTRTITQPSQINANTSTTNSTCGNANGAATSNPTGGSSPYTYLWSTTATTQAINGLLSGLYTVTVTDNNSCTATGVATVNNSNGPLVAQDSLHNVRCFGQSNGGIFISISGGATPYSYTWSNGATTKNINNIPAGTYTVTVTDNNSCTANLSAIVTEPVVLNATSSSTNSTCGNANGTATVNPTGGLLPYTYLWSNAQTTQTAVNLSAATYTCTITDANTCTKMRVVIVGSSPGPTLSLDSVVNVKCFGGANGRIYITKSGGTTPFSYLWSNLTSSQDLLNVAAGTYTVTVTDNNSCTATLSATITQPVQLTANTSTQSSSCGSANGAATVAPSGGTSPFTYLWSNAQTTQTSINLLAGNYSVTVTDNNACTVNKNVSVANIAGPVLTLDSVINVKCNGGLTGKIYVSVSSGTPPFTYLWSNSFTGQDLLNVAAGTYTVTVTDDSSCTATLSATITQPSVLNATISSANTTCGNSNGSATVNPTGGTSPYTFLWSNAQTTQTISGIAAATYTVTVTDNNSCTTVKTVTITDTSGPALLLDSVVNVKCFGAVTGDIFISLTGGTSPFSYLWSNNSTSQDLINVIAGTYTVTITDANSCTGTLSATITQPAVLNDSTTTTNTLCGNSTGTATVFPYGGTFPYTYLWSTTATTQTITGLGSGSYTVTVTDTNNCTVQGVAVVSNTGGATITIDSIINVRCNGQNNGAIYVNVFGGTPPYSYTWSNGTTVEDNINIAANCYTLIVLDQNNCLSTISACVTQPTALTDSINTTNSTCGNANGSATAYGVGGTGPYTYLWSTTATTQGISNVSSGFYTVTVTDSHNCTVSSVASVGNISGPTVVLDSIRNVKCFGQSNGGVFISITGGTSPFAYLWSNAATTQDISGVLANTYTVTVTDNNSCTATKTATVTQPVVLSDSTSTTNSTCGGANGTATVFPYGGTSPYTYLWSTNATTQTITGLIPGNYTVTVTDANNCTVSSIATVVSTGGPVITLDSLVNVKCFGQSNGGIFISVIGGLPPYTYTWSNGPTTQDNPNIPAGPYTVFVLDANSCLSTQNWTVTQPTVLNDSITKVNATCSLPNGQLTVYGYGGTSPYTYLWSAGAQTTQTITGLNAGTYTVTVTDNKGCTKVSSSTITNAAGPVIALDSVRNVLCFGQSNGAIYISVIGGTNPLTYLWSNTQTTQDITNLISGCYSVTVTDANTCTDTMTICITQPAVLNDSISITPATCGTNNGSLTVYPFGGTNPYGYLWSAGNQTTQTINNLATGTYTVTITDDNGCTKVSSATVFNIGGPTITLDSIVHVKCNGGNTGAIYIMVNGGTLPYDYLWSNTATTDDITGVVAGTYTVTVTDANNCITSASYTINQPPPLNDSISVVNATCGNANGSLTVYPYGGTGSGYSFVWSAGGQTTATISNLSAGAYTVTITDANNCTRVDSATVSNIAGPSIVLDSIVHIKCNGGNDGAIYISVNGGAPSFTYLWSNTETVDDISNLTAGCYTVTVTDANNCTDTAIFCVTEPNALTDSISFTPDTCGSSNGTATVYPIGGSNPYGYLWPAGNQTTQTITGLAAGTYTVTITDLNLCTKIDSIIVGSVGGPNLILDSLVHVKCFGGNNGAIYITASGGTQPYDYLWSNTATTDDITGLIAGCYTLTVTDANTCSTTVTYCVIEPTALNDSITVIDATCGNANGLLTVYPYGGTGTNYTYLWSTTGSDTTQTVDSLLAGVYTVTVTDENGCTIVSSDTIGSISGPSVVFDSTYNVNCFGGNDGAIFITPSGGTPGYSYLWSNTFTTEDINGITAGTYTITVTDSNFCSFVDSIIISEPPELSDSIVVMDATCNTANGCATVYPFGGNGPYTYLWFNSDTSQTVCTLPAGSYTVTITDAHGCIHTDAANISNIGGPTVIIDSVKNVSCHGGNDGAIYTTVAGGSPPYIYLWSESSTIDDIINLPAGAYTLTVTDAANCINIVDTIITEPDSIVLAFSSTNPRCGINDGTATVTPTGGIPPYTYAWSDGQTTQTAFGLFAGTYFVTVSDSNGCSIIDSLNVINPNTPVISNPIVTNVTCNGDQNGSINIDVSSGTQPYSYVWTNPFPIDTTQDLLNVGAGTYTITITDSANCTTDTTFTITEPDAINIQFFITDASCDSSNGSAIAIISGGVGTYSLLWSDFSTNDTLLNLAAGSYTLTVTDANLCIDSSIANISNFSAPVITVIDSGNVSCHGAGDGFITVSISGGAPPYTLSWTNTSQTDTAITNLGGGTYTLTVIDNDSCKRVYSVTLSEPDSITIQSDIPLLNGIYHISCHGGEDGSINLNPFGGCGGYTFLWSNFSTTEDISNIGAGNYIVTVTDSCGCSYTAGFTLFEPPELIAIAEGDFVICGVDNDTLNASPPTYGTGGWVVAPGLGSAYIANPDSAVTLIDSLGIGDNLFYWIVKDDYCADTASVIVKRNSAIIAIAGVNREVCEDTVVLLATSPQFGYGYWQVVSGTGIISDTLNANTHVTSLSPGTNTFLWTVINGNCTDAATVSIKLKNPSDCLDPVEIPSGLTPNGDGQNDFFLVRGLEDYFDNSIVIYNRWGNKVFEQSPYLNNWDGVNEKGALLPEGTYFYILKIKSIEKTLNGYIDLRR